MSLQGKMIEKLFHFQALQPEDRIENRKNVIVLRDDPSHRYFAQSSILFERFMEDFYRPSFLIGRQNWPASYRYVTASQIENSRAAIFVGKDLAHEVHRKKHVFEPTCEHRLFLPEQVFNRWVLLGAW